MPVNVPSKELIFTGKYNELEADGFLDDYLKMIRISDILALAFGDYIEITSGNYRSMMLSEFFSRLHNAYTDKDKCPKRIRIDDAMLIANQSFQALNHIVSSPSYEIIKKEEMAAPYQMRKMETKTMQWLSKRPGRTVNEKIYPKNKLPVMKSFVSYDTKENRETLYLYRQLRRSIDERWNKSKCAGCDKDCPFAVIKTMRKVMELKNRIKAGNLAFAVPQQQFIQNNKLMCDKYYKIIWDAAAEINRFENRLEDVWKNLEQRRAAAASWLFISEYFLYRENAAIIVDDLVQLVDENGKLKLISADRYKGQEVKIFSVFYPENPVDDNLISYDDKEGLTLLNNNSLIPVENIKSIIFEDDEADI